MVKTFQPLGALSSQLNIAPRIRVALDQSTTDGSPREALDPRAAAIRALAAPLNFPPFAQATVPGDHLAIAVDDAIPSAVNIVLGAVEVAEAAGIEPQAISIITSNADFAGTLQAGFEHRASGVKFVIHDPDDAQDLCLVGSLEKGGPLLINRAIYDADVVLPIGCARLVRGTGGGGVYDSLFPRFCDAETIGRLRTPTQRESAARQADVRRKTEEAGWLIGAPLVMQVVPGRDGKVADVVAGEPAAVTEHCQQLCRRLWSLQVARRASLVIATVTGEPHEQSWENIGRALAAVEPLVEEGGAVAICSDLESPPGAALSRLIGSSDWQSVERDARNDHSPDSWPAWHVARALQRGPLYFLSRLDDETVEEMGLAPIASVDELVRLAGRHESCIVLDDSQYAVASVAGGS